MKVKVIDSKGKETGDIEVGLILDNAPENLEHIVYLVNNYQNAMTRQGTHSTKSRSDVRGGGAKPYKQKGLGRARRGTSRSPLIVGGGVIFGPKPRTYDQKINNRTIRKAVYGALGSKKDALVVLEDNTIKKTKDVVSILKDSKRTLIILNVKNDETLGVAARNIQNCWIASDAFIPVSRILNSDKIILTKSVVEKWSEEKNGK